MRNITFTEWTTEIGKVADQLRTRWPWLRISSDHQQLSIAAPSCSGDISLRSASDERCMAAHPMVASSSSLGSDTRVARAQIIEATAICDALDVATSLLGAYRVWAEGKCPCDMCGARGKSGGVQCEGCEGKGRR